MTIKDDQSNTLVNKGLKAALEALENAETPEKRRGGAKDIGLFKGFDEKESFASLSYKEQEAVINEYVERAKSGALGSAEELMEGLHYKPPAPTPATPTPLFSAPSPGGMGGGGNKVVRFPPTTPPPVEQNNDGSEEDES